MTPARLCLRCNTELRGMRSDARYCGKQCRVKATKERMRRRHGDFIRGTARQCRECGAGFRARRMPHVYCTDACARTAERKRTAKSEPERSCLICETRFSPNSSMHRFCSGPCLRIRQRQVRLAAKYGLTDDAFEAILAKQGGGCAICETRSGRMAVDHDHACCDGRKKTCGKCTRGILCFPCNQALGLLRDSPKLIARAFAYRTSTHSNEPDQKGSDYA